MSAPDLSTFINANTAPLSDGEFLVDEKGNIVGLTLRTEIILGKTRTEIIKQPASTYLEFDEYSNQASDVLISDLVHYKKCIEEGTTIETLIRSGRIKASSKSKAAKFVIMPLLIETDLKAAVVFVITENEDVDIAQLKGRSKDVVILTTWFLSIWKENTLATIFLIFALMAGFAIFKIDKLNFTFPGGEDSFQIENKVKTKH